MKINFDKISDLDLYSYSYPRNYEPIKGEAYDTEVTASLTRCWYEKVEKGTRYDYLQKKNVTKYEYQYRTEVVGEYTINTKNGVGALTSLPIDDKNSSYYFDLSYKDSKGRTVECTRYSDSGMGMYYQSDYKKFRLQPSETSFKENDTMHFDLYMNGSVYEENEGRVFYQVFGTDLIESGAFDGTSFDLKYQRKYIPTVAVCGAYFDGRHIYPVSLSWEIIKFDPSDRKIELEITSDKDEYSPADKAEVTVSAKDINGNAVEGASVIISVVDEAAFSVSPQNADPLGDIYAMIWPGYVTQYYSYIQHVEDLYGDGEKGGGEGEESIRKDFKDTALFEPVTTDKDGKCTVTIPLPDNITKWRVTAAAVKETETDVVYAGAAKSPVIATKPLFVSPVMLGKYVEGDDIAVTAKLFGASKGTKISVSISGNGVNNSLAITANETANFGKLDAGEYTVRFSAKENGSSDTVEMKLTVVDSLLEIPVTEEHILSELSNLFPARWPVSVTFFNDDYRLYAQTLLFLNFRLGDRLDMRIAHFYAMKELGFITEEEYKGEFGNIVSGGLAKLMDNSEGSPELTALICAAAPELINTASVTKKFNNITNNKESSHSDVANAYLGLAALNKPVLNSVKYALEHGEGFDIYDDLRLTAALAFLGDYDNAQKYYEKYASDIKYDGDKAYLNGDSPVELTQTALLAASLLHRPEADKMARYLLDGKEVYDSYALELMVYVKNYHPEHTSDAVFTFVRDGQTKTVTLDKVFGTTITFDKAQLEAAEFTEKSGKVYAVVNYTTGNIGKGDGDLTISKKLVSESGNFRKGEIVTVSINASPFCCIYDVIPSCGRFNDCRRYCRENGQSIRLYTDEAGCASYSFRLITEGEYVVESAAAVSCEGYALSGRSEITVNG
ncbi:MAG: alpha-2-macroglobulin family protein [Huintestinicola sp.]